MKSNKKEISLEDERDIAERNIRTFNGVTYNSLAEMQIARDTYRLMEADKAVKNYVNKCAVWCLVLSMIMLPLIPTVVGWAVAYIGSIICGIYAIKNHTDKKICVIIGLSLDALMIVPLLYALFTSIKYTFCK